MVSELCAPLARLAEEGLAWDTQGIQDLVKLALSAACGRLKASPFSEDTLEFGRRLVPECLVEHIPYRPEELRATLVAQQLEIPAGIQGLLTSSPDRRDSHSFLSRLPP